jgi:hypothetical protein
MLKSKGRFAAAGTAIAVATSAAAVLLLGGGSATAGTTAVAPANTVTGTSVVDGSLYQRDFNQDVINKVFRVPGYQSVTGWSVKPGSLTEVSLSKAVKDKLNAVGTGAPGKDGTNGTNGTNGVDGKDGAPGVTNLESDSPYPGATQLADNAGNGANSTAKFVGKSAELQRAWVQCADGKTAIGGGYQRADEGAAAIKNLQIVTSSPTQIKDGKEVYEPIDGDKAGSVKPNAWLVEGFNNGDTDLIVRPSVICANVG